MNTSLLSVIQNTDFRKLWLSQITSQIALNMLLFVLALHVYTTTHSNTAVSLMLLTFGIPSIIFGVIAGGVVDHYDKRSIMLFCNFSRAILLIVFFLFAKQPLIFIYILAVLISIITQLFIPAEAPSIPILVKPKQLLAANSLFTISYYLSTVIGFILAGPALRIFGNEFVYIVIGILMGIATYFVYTLPKLKPKSTHTHGLKISEVFTTIKEGIVFIQKHDRVKQSLYLMTFSQALISTLSVLAPGFADKVLSIELTDSSFLVMGPAALGLILGASFVGSQSIKILRGTLILRGIILTGINLLLLSLMTSATKPSITFYAFESSFTISYLVISILLLITLGIWNSFVNVPANTILQEDSSVEVRGRIYGVLTALTGGVSLIPVIFSGILADVLGVGKALAMLGFVILAIGINQVRKRPEVLEFKVSIK